LRKVVGAYRTQIMQQFLGESVLLASFCALGIVLLVLPELNAFTGKTIALNGALFLYTLLGILFMALLTGVLAGIYPAFFLSRFEPAQVLKGSLARGVRSGRLRQGLVVFQFRISAFLIAATYTLKPQMRYIQNMDLGFDKELMVMTGIFSTDRYVSVKNAFLQHPNILMATASHATMGYGGQLDRVYPEGRSQEDWRMRVLGVDETFLETYGLSLVAGRNFSLDMPTDTTHAFILNETAVKRLGWEEPLGKAFGWSQGNHGNGKVIGVVKDFHNRSLREDIRPTVIAMWQPRLTVLSLKIRAVRSLENAFQSLQIAFHGGDSSIERG
jgi:putative ABC transport system permease protein